MKVRVTIELDVESSDKEAEEYGEDILTSLHANYMDRFSTSEIESIKVTKCSLVGGKSNASRGGKRRAKVLSPERRSQIARLAAEARWGKK